MNTDRADSFLRLIKRSQRGKLKIYVGYAAGVGKTYQMLLEAQRLREDGVDLAAGLVETHGRVETEALLSRLEMIPRHRIAYHGIEIEEMNLEAIQSRHPAVVLVDELAHSNIPGSKNSKRFQDVEEILAAGIHVISTLNVQHLESLYETVERATGIKVRERIPDRIVAEADQLVNVDLTPEDLRRRLAEGKVYTKERIDTALDHFFQKSNLEQLRELTLRELAAQIDSKRRESFTETAPSSPDQVMVCLSSRGPNTDALIRFTSRLAGRLNRNWYAVYVQTAKERPTSIDAATQRALSRTLNLAQQLGATVFTYKGEDVVDTILRFAKEYRVGHIVIGTPGKKTPFWKRLYGQRGIVERLIDGSKGIAIVVVDTKPFFERAADDTDRSITPPAETTVPYSGNMPEDIGRILTDAYVKVWEVAITKEDAMKELLIGCQERFPFHRENAWKALIAREKQGGTFLGEDVSLPHARITDISYPIVALGVSREGIMDPAEARNVKIMFLLLSAADHADSHVKMLGAISRIARDDLWRRTLIEAKSIAEIKPTIT